MADPTEVERIKARSRHLRGTIDEGLVDELTGAIAEEDTQLTKFHGLYQQDDRDVRGERRRRRLEPAFSFMIRVRVPGGVVTPAQWLALDELAGTHANETLRLTTRQAIQFHGVAKRRLKGIMAGINATLLDTFAACGDVNRNVMCSPNPVESPVHAEAFRWAARISEHLTPRTRAYHEIWLDGEKTLSTDAPVEPIYGDTYLPRKFKIAMVVPPQNDTDVLAHDLGFIAIVEAGRLAGFNVTVGGGMGMSHGEPDTFPRLADVIGFCRPGQVLDVAEHVVTTQRDYGDRTNRKHARLKYTIEDRGVAWFREELERRLGFALEPAREFHFEHTGDRYGWVEGHDGRWSYTLFIENGRVADRGGQRLRTALRELARRHDGDFRITANQNLVIAGVAAEARDGVEGLLREHGVVAETSPRRLNAMACVGLPTCALAMAESERYLPELIGRIDGLLARHGLDDEPVVIRMTGCPNGCARPYLAEIGLVGKGPGKYNLYLGAAFDGTRLNRPYRENIGESEVLSALDQLFAAWAGGRRSGERFGDFLVRSGEVAAVAAGRDFHG